MIILTNPSTLELVLGSSVTTSQLPYYIAYVDSTSTTHNPLQGSGVSNDTTIVTVLSTPIVSTIRTIKYISIHNKDTTSKQVFLQINDTVNTRTLVDFTLDAGDRIEYTDTVGFRVISSLGEVKTVSTGNSITPASLTKVDDTNVTLTLGGSPTTALLQPTSLTLGWTGTLADARIASAATWNAKQAPFTILSTLGALADASGVLTNNGAGVLSWGAAGGSQTPWTSNISAAGYTLFGNSTSGGNLTLASTSNATKGKILFGTSAYDEVNNQLGIGTTSPGYPLDVVGAINSQVTGASVNFVAQNPGNGYPRGKMLIDYNNSAPNNVGFAIAPAYGTNSQFYQTLLSIDNNKVDTNSGYRSTSILQGIGYASIAAIGGVGGNSAGDPLKFSTRTFAGNNSGLVINNDTNQTVNIGTDTLSTTAQLNVVARSTLYAATFAGNVGIGQSSPTAYLHLKAGTATAGTAPLKLTSGTNLTTPENGTFEYDGTNLYFTVGGVRKTVTLI